MAREQTNFPKNEVMVYVNEDKELAGQSQYATHMHEIDLSYGDDMPYNLDRLIQETRFYMAQSAEAIIETGKRLILIKEHEGHGNFMNALEKIGIEQKSANKVMKIATRFSGSNYATSRNLNHVGKSKLIELLVLDDEEIKELGEGGTVRGLKSDDIDRMGIRELRHSLRQTRAKAEKAEDVHKKIIEQKNGKLDEYERSIIELENKPQPLPDWDKEVRQMQTNLLIESGMALLQYEKLGTLRNQIRDHASQCSELQYRTMAAEYLFQMERLIAELNALATLAHEEFADIILLGQEPDYLLSELPEVHAPIDGQ